MYLKKEQVKSKKNGKTYTGYKVVIEEYETPLFFPSKIESMYLDEFIADQTHKDFKGDDLNDLENK